MIYSVQQVRTIKTLKELLIGAHRFQHDWAHDPADSIKSTQQAYRVSYLLRETKLKWNRAHYGDLKFMVVAIASFKPTFS